jgi:hypothetical protein
VGGFFSNFGQFNDGSVGFYSPLGGGCIAFRESEVVISILERGSYLDAIESADRGYLVLESGMEALRVQGCTVVLGFEGARPVVPSGRGVMQGENNFFLGNDPEGWVTGVREYSEVIYENLYEGIDLAYRLVGGIPKYEFRVHPGADPADISISVRGHERLSIADGGLVISTCVGDIVDDGLRAFHEGSPLEPLKGEFDVRSQRQYGFNVPKWDIGRMLIIDPLVQSTYVGGNGREGAARLDTDDDGNIYITGQTESANYPTTAGAFDFNHGGWLEGFVTKLDPTASKLLYSTFIGGEDFDSTYDIAVDEDGAVYVAGTTSSRSFPLTVGAYCTTQTGGDGFVAKINTLGKRLEYSTLIGGSDLEHLNAITIDDSGNAYIVGRSQSDDFPVTLDAYQSKPANPKGRNDAVISKFNPDGTRLLYSSYIGGSKGDEGMDIFLDSSGGFYVAGDTNSEDFPTTSGALKTRLAANDWDGFLTRFKNNGSDLEYSTFIGGTGGDHITGITEDNSGNATIVGYTKSGDFPITQGTFQDQHVTGTFDSFVMMLDSNGSSVVRSTFLGGSNKDRASTVRIDSDGSLYVAGDSESWDFPTTAKGMDLTLNGTQDGFFAILSANMSELKYCTFIGGSSEDSVWGLEVLNRNSFLLSGYTESRDFNTTPGAYKTKFNGGRSDCFISHLALDISPPTADAGPDIVIDQHETVWFNGSASRDNNHIINWSWMFNYSSGWINLHGPLTSYTFHDAGVFVVTLKVTDNTLLTGIDTMNVTVRDITPPVAEAGENITIDQNRMVNLDGRLSSDNVGVVNYTWEFNYAGELITLEGATASFAFHEPGVYNVSLVVRDAVDLSDMDWVVVTVRDSTSPVAAAGPDVTVPQHTLVQFDGSNSSDNVGIIEWKWSLQHTDGPVSLDGERTQFTFDDVGRYVVTLTVKDREGNNASDVIIVTVKDTTPPHADAGPDQRVGAGTTVQFDGWASWDNVRITSFRWTFDYFGEEVTLQGGMPQYTFERPGSFLVNMTVSDFENNSAWDTMIVTVDDMTFPVANAGDDVIIDQGGMVPLDGRGSYDNVGIVHWTWTLEYNNTEVSLDGSTTGFTFDIAGMYEIELMVEDEVGLTDVDSLIVTVRDTTDPVAIIREIGSVEFKEHLQFDGSDSFDNVGIVSYRWLIEGGQNQVPLYGQLAYHSFNATGTHTVFLTVKDAAGNSGSTYIAVQVVDSVDPVLVVKGSKTYLRNERSNLDASQSTDNVGIVNWTWEVIGPDGKVVARGYDQVLRYRFDETGLYDIKVTIRDGDGNIASQTIVVRVEGKLWPWLLLLIIIIVFVVAVLVVRRRRGRV